MESLIQQVFERSFEGKEKQEPSKAAAPAPVPLDSGHSTKSLQEQFGVDVREAGILVMGAGGAGNNAMTRLTDIGIKGAQTIAINTDAKHLSVTKANKKLLIGKDLTHGLGAGGYPGMGRKAAEESEKEIKKMLQDCDMLYLVAGLGGGTGTGAAPVIAKIAKELGTIVIGCVTMPFKIEGARIGKAEDGLYQLRQVCDTVIVIENDRLLKIAGDLPLQQAFGVAAVGFGESDTKNRAEEAITKAMTNPLLEVDYTGGLGALIHITGGNDLKLDEANVIGEYVSKLLDPEAQIIWGARVDPSFQGKIQVITIITGVKSPYILGPVAQEEFIKKQDFAQDLGIPVLQR